MKLLLILLGVMTFVVESKNSVTMDGLYPYGIEVNYANTGQKGSVTAGQVATLSLSNLSGISIDQIIVYVKSNKSTGAGTFSISTNGQTITTKSGSFKDWTGGWDNANYHAISFLNQPVSQVYSMEIKLEGTANSLHIEKYEIQWTQAPSRTVTLMCGDRIYDIKSETPGGSGIILPNVPDSAEWSFVGWSEIEFWSSSTMPNLYMANTSYFPVSDDRLWAVFKYQSEEQEDGYATELTDGNYRYVNSENNEVLTGVPISGRMASEPLNMSKEEQVYSIQFSNDGTATITHTKTGTPIGYSGTQMASTNSPWKVFHENEETIFYIEHGGKKYVLWLNILDNSGTYFYAGLRQAGALNSPMRLLKVTEESEDPYYTCHPEVPMGIEEVKDGIDETGSERLLMHIGNYKLKIKNGKKIIEL